MLNSIDVADGDRLLNAGAAVFVDSGMNEVQITRFPTDERLTILDTKRYTGCILLELLTYAPAISRPAICEKLHLSDRQVRTAIDFLKANGKIHREEPAKGGKWIVD